MHVHVDPAPVVVPPVGRMGEHRAGGEVGALAPADRLEGAHQPVQVTRPDDHVDVGRAAPGWPQAGQQGRPLDVEEVDARTLGEVLDHRMSEVDPGRHGDADGVVAEVSALTSPIQPSCPHGASTSPRLRRMTFAEFVRMTRAYLWLLVLLTALGAGVMIAKTSREPVLYSARRLGHRQGRLLELGRRGAGQRVARLRQGRPVRRPGGHHAGRREGRGRARTRRRPPAIAGRFSASVDTDVNLLSVQAVGTTPEEARDLANTVVEAVAEVAEDIENTGRPANAKGETLVQVVPLEQAQLPGAPFTPDYQQAAMKGAGGGLVLAYRLPHRPAHGRPQDPVGQGRRDRHRRLRHRDHPQGRGHSRAATAASVATSGRRPRRSASCAPTCASSTWTTPRAAS